MNYDIQAIRRLLATGDGRELHRYLVDRLADLRDIRNIQETHPDVALITLATLKAHNKLSEILSFLDSTGDTPENENNEYIVLP